MSDVLMNLSPIEILGLTIIGEARGEPIQGQVAVGCVIRNRLHNNTTKYKNYSDVCLESKQFSCWNENDPNRVVLLELAEKMLVGNVSDNIYYKQCMWVASGIVHWQIVDNTRGALHYMTVDLFDSDRKPKWARTAKDKVVHGKQIFFDI